MINTTNTTVWVFCMFFHIFSWWTKDTSLTNVLFFFYHHFTPPIIHRIPNINLREASKAATATYSPPPLEHLLLAYFSPYAFAFFDFLLLAVSIFSLIVVPNRRALLATPVQADSQPFTRLTISKNFVNGQSCAFPFHLSSTPQVHIIWSVFRLYLWKPVSFSPPPAWCPSTITQLPLLKISQRYNALTSHLTSPHSSFLVIQHAWPTAYIKSWPSISTPRQIHLNPSQWSTGFLTYSANQQKISVEESEVFLKGEIELKVSRLSYSYLLKFWFIHFVNFFLFR